MMQTRTNNTDEALLRGIEHMATDIHGLAAGLGVHIEDAGAALARLEAKGMVEFVCGCWMATSQCRREQEQS